MSTENLRKPYTVGPALLLAHNLFKPKIVKRADRPDVQQYSVLLGFDKSDPNAVAVFHKLQEAAAALATSKWGRVLPHLRSPGKDGDAMNEAAVANGGTAKAYRKGRFILPLAADANPQFPAPEVLVYGNVPISSPSDIYPGCTVYVSAILSTYSVKGNSGVQAYLQHVLKYTDGPRLGGGGIRPDEAFANVPPPPAPPAGELDDDEAPF